MEKTFTILWCVLLFSGRNGAHAACDQVKADIIFLIDASGSVGGDNFVKELGFAADFSSAFQIGHSALQVGVVRFSTTADEMFNLKQHDTKADLVAAIRHIDYTQGSTSTDLGLDYIRQHGFTAASGDRPDAPNIVIVLTDGKSDVPQMTAASAKQLRDTGAEIYALGIGQGIGSAELETVATDNSHVTMVDGFDELAGVKDTIRNSLCSNLDPCTNNPCMNGSCHSTGGTAICQCVPGYTGVHCQTDIDECQGNSPCQHGGTCQNTKGSFQCACPAGFSGDVCQHDVKECTSLQPCLNGATCYNTVGSYTCVCTPGFRGQNCDLEIDECLSDPCQNGGSCQDAFNSYRCHCLPGFTGLQCQIDTDECIGVTCENGGTCQDGRANYTCQCCPGYTGRHCETEINECERVPCQNGGTCTDLLNNYTCSCAEYFFGRNCEINLCSDVDDSCGTMFGVCRDPVKKVTMCRRTCGVCGHGQVVFLGQTDPPSTGAVCEDTAVNCKQVFGICRNRTLAETDCRRTCGVCVEGSIIFG